MDDKVAPIVVWLNWLANWYIFSFSLCVPRRRWQKSDRKTKMIYFNFLCILHECIVLPHCVHTISIKIPFLQFPFNRHDFFFSFWLGHVDCNRIKWMSFQFFDNKYLNAANRWYRCIHWIFSQKITFWFVFILFLRLRYDGRWITD